MFGLIDDWLAPNRPIILSGMVGSNLGWAQVPYLQCPAALTRIALERTRLSARGVDVSLLPGLQVVNPAGHPDVMRGEELQALGWLALNQALGGPAPEEALLVAPGTHSKWMQVKDGILQTFVTGLTGEVFALLERHSLLLASPSAKAAGAGTTGSPTKTIGETTISPAFDLGLAAIEKLGSASLMQALFTVRSRQLSGELAAAEARDYLSGLLIGADLQGAQHILGQTFDQAKEIIVIGEGEIGAAYLHALQKSGKIAQLMAPTRVAVAGYREIHRLTLKDA